MACTFSGVYRGCACPVGYNVPLVTVDQVDITLWPVIVLNVNEEELGQAETPSEYVEIWNSDPDNQAVGTLYVGGGSFCFYLKVRTGVTPIEFVLGQTPDLEGIITEGGDFILTEGGERLIVE